MAEEKAAPPIADPAALGLGGFALTTFILSAHNAGWAPDVVWIGLALFYGGLGQFMAGMWEFRNRNTFGATAFSTYGAFWLALGTFALLAVFGKVPESALPNSLGWFILSFAIFNTYMLFWSVRVNVAVFFVFLTLEATEIVLAVGLLGGAPSIVKLGGYVGVLTAAVAWYASAAVVINNMSSRPVLPVGAPMWRDRPAEAAATRPSPTS
jgi:uncharacterized protein